MPRSLSLLLLAPLLAVAAPVPKVTVKAKIEKKFGGKIVDPKGDSTFDLDGDKLTITLPAKEDRRFGYTEGVGGRHTKFDNTPHVEFEREGDFVLTVLVSSPLTDGAKSGPEGHDPHVGGGVRLIRKDADGFHFGVVRSASRSGLATAFPANQPGHFHDGLGGQEVESLKGDANWLRVRRIGKDAFFEVSGDGKEWKGICNGYGRLPDDTITVGLYAQHGSDTKHTVTFDEFKIETPKK